MRKEVVVAAAYAQREATLRRVATLPDPAWDRPCDIPAPPPGVVRLETPVRTVRDIVAHLVVVDEMLLRSGLRGIVAPRRDAAAGAWDRRRLDPVAALDVTDLVTLLARRGERVAQVVAAAPAALAHVPLHGPFGRQPMLHVVARRVLHEWLHERDIAGEVAAATVPPREIAETLADAVLVGLPLVTLPAIPLTEGVVRLVVDVAEATSLETPAPGRRTWGVDFTRHQYGPRVLRTPDATIWMTATALALLASGRAGADGPPLPLEVRGRADLAHELLGALAVPSEHDVAPGSPIFLG